MSVRFFGQFLVEEGEIDALDLRRALQHMERMNLPLGQLAVREGLLRPEDAERVNARQREVDRPFGALAVEMGLLRAGQAEALLERQSESRIPIGETLVRLGLLAPERLMPLLDRFKADQADYRAGAVRLPDALAGSRAAEVVLDFLPKFAMRVARMPLKTGAAGPVARAPQLPHRVAVSLRCDAVLEVGLACDAAFARPVVAATCAMALERLDEGLIDDGLGEFLNLVVGNAVSALEREGLHADLAPPRLAPPLQEGFEVETAAGAGELWVVLRRA